MFARCTQIVDSTGGFVENEVAEPIPGTDRYRLTRDYPGLNPFVAACLVIDNDNHAQRLWRDDQGSTLYDLLRTGSPST